MRREFAGLGIALGSVAVAILIRKLLDPILGNLFELPIVFGAVAIAAWLGGFWPSVVAAVAGYLAADYLFMEPRGSVGILDPDALVGIALYLLTCATIITLGVRVRRAERQRRSVEAERLRFVRQLEVADRMKDEFLATLAHELRNPLAPIRNASYILKQHEPHDSKAQWARAVIDRQSAHLSRLVDDLLDVSRITRGLIEMRRERIPISQVVSSAIETARPWIESRHHALTMSVPAEPLVVFGDPTRLAQALSNLVTNAAKYTPPNGRIHVAAEPDPSGLAVRVSDNGVGIPGPMLDRIFEMFTQVDTSPERTSGGLGIGLTLAQRLAGLHGGTLEAKSPGLGRGSEFVLRLPLASVTEQPAAPPPAHHPEHEAGGRILVVDDNPDAADSLARLLADDGHEVRVARDAEEAMREFVSFRPDTVVLDIGLPDVSGYEIARRIRKELWGQAVRLVALTGWGQEEDRRRSREAGFDEHVIKPIDPAALLTLLRSARAETPV
jgi:signal transduction histidine kinase/ActR/RegA family two-component response regulator